ncbi:MAG: restriction endonuclease subunit S, partial [Kiritimatiellae bacterium]|nr:restriction endonuclease subunit S [Kiritimatiellia bacterium]
LLPLWAKQGCTVESIDQGFMGNTYLPLPPVPEQKAIAAFLDRETKRIDGLIRKREKLIVLLQEKRAALISHAVTKGLNPSAKMKPSGIDWLGNIPAHWETDKIKYNTFSCSGGTPNTENQDYWNGDIPWVSPKDMKASRISATEDSITELGLKESASRLIDENTVLIVVRSGILKHTIPVAINVVPVSINQDMKALFTKEKVTSDYLFYFINGVQENLLPLWRKQGCTVESIEQEFMGNTCLPIPPVSEQKAIAEYLDTETKKIDGLLEKEQQIIERMKEYRSALISAAVTGKIDVRETV